jgi:tetratricopeptide (TPR) repeat protein
MKTGFTLCRCALLSLTALTLLAAMPAGCGRQGKYTKEHTNVAKEKMGMLKSATEYQMANQAFHAGDLQKANKHIDYSIGLSPKVAKSYVLKGRVMLEMGNLEKAAACFAEAEVHDAKSVDAAYFRGVLAERVARKEEALKWYMTAADLAPTDAQYCIAAAEMLIDLQRVDEADAFLRAKMDTFINNAGIKQVMGNIAMLRGDTKVAQELYSESRLLDPDNEAVIESLVRAQLANGDLAEAEVNLSKMLSNRGMAHRRDLLHMRADCLVHLDRPIEARDLYLQLTKDVDGAADVKAWRGLGQVAYLLRDTSRVRLCAARLVAIAPESPDGWMLRGLLNRRSGDLAAAKMSFEQAVRLGGQTEAYVMLGSVQQDLGMHEEARASFRAAMDQEPSNPLAAEMYAGVPTE